MSLLERATNRGLPFAGNPSGFYFVMFGILTALLLALWLLRRIGVLQRRFCG